MDFTALTSLFSRFGSGSYHPFVVLTELFLIGLLVNWCAGVLHGTRGTRLLRGLLVVLIGVTLVVRLLADQLGWARLDLLYNYFIIGMAFIALVAFQPELRRALMRAGEMRFLQRVTTENKVVSALVESAGYLSRNKYGALIAIQRDVGLTNWVEHGTQINAEVSADLLKSLFYPNSALHDLGVVIRGNRILAAGCQFPVAESGEVDTSLGSRHRAAVGLSTESDALILIISEETGTISIADNGKLTRYLALDDLQDELETRLTPKSFVGRRRTLRTFSDFWRVARRLLVVLPLTLVIWFLAEQGSQIRADGIDVQVRVLPPRGVHVDMVDPPARFTLAVRGPSKEIDALRAATAERPLRADWELPDAYARVSGTQTLEETQLRALLESLPDLQQHGVFVDDVTPGQFSFVVDEEVERTIPVRINAGSLRVATERVEPAEVEVWLRRADLDRLDATQMRIEAMVEERLEGEPRNRLISISDATLGTRITDGELEVNALRVEPASVSMSLRIVAETRQVRLDGIRVQLAMSPQDLQRYDIDIVDANEWLLSLELEGDASIVDRLRPQDVRAWVAFSGARVEPGGAPRAWDVEIDLPEGVTLLGPARQVQFGARLREGATP